jgi:DNA-directed RNA polymerase beta subunit
MYALSHKIRADTIAHVLDYPQRPLVNTIPADMMGFNDMPSGINAIIAIGTYTGFNQVRNILFSYIFLLTFFYLGGFGYIQ